jgi:hypothetical protein
MSTPSESDTIAEHVHGDGFPERENFCEQLEDYIEANPFRSMLFALLAGMAVAKLLL